jgi:uncharacterized lipoprotein YmbA
MKYNLAVLLLLFLLPGCLSFPSSPSPRFYTLEPIKEVSGVELSGADHLSNAVLGVGPVTIPEYLNRPQMVTRNSDNSIEFAQFDRWAEPLDAGIARIIARNFSLLLPKASVEIFPWNSIIPIKYQVIMEIIQLDCRLDGDALLLVQWSVIDGKEKKVLLTKRSEYRKPIESKNYSGLIQAVSSICGSLSTEIAQVLTQLAIP